MAKRKHLSAKGVPLDFDLMQYQNKHAVAVGNASMNANGDIIGKGGKIIRKVSDIPAEQQAVPTASYNQANPKSTRLVSLKDKIDTVVDTPKHPVLEDKIEEQLESKEEVLTEDSAKEKSKPKRKIVDSED